MEEAPIAWTQQTVKFREDWGARSRDTKKLGKVPFQEDLFGRHLVMVTRSIALNP